MPRSKVTPAAIPTMAQQIAATEYAPKLIPAAAWATITKAAAQEKDSATATDKAIDGLRLAFDGIAVAAKMSRKDFAAGNARKNEYRQEVNTAFGSLFGESAARNYATSFWLCFETGQEFIRSAGQLASKAAKGPDQNRSSPVISLSKEIKKFEAAGANIITLLDNPKIPAMDIRALCKSDTVSVEKLVALILSHVTENDDAE